MKKREIFLLSALAFSVGTVFGFLISPAKNGMGNNTTQNYYGKDDTSNKEDSAITTDTSEKVQ